MNTKSKRRIGPSSRPITLLLAPNDREHLEELAIAWDCSLAEGVRRCIGAEFERLQEERFSGRLDALREINSQQFESTQRLSMDLSELRARIEALFVVVRGIEKSTESKLEEIAEPTNASAIRLLALIRTLKTREDVEREIQNILSGK